MKPLLSIVVPTLNNEKTIPKFITTLKNQTYPFDNIELIFSDGGSTDTTLLLARQNNVKIVHNLDILAEPGVSRGMMNAKGELIMILATDNYYLSKNALQTIIHVFNDKKIYAAFPKHNSESHYSIFSKYHNTFTDPFNHFAYGNAANARTFKRIYKTIEHNDVYDIYDFTSNSTLPMIALAQGFTIRSSFKRKPEDTFDDCKPVIDLIKQNKNIAYIHSISIYHDTTRDLKHFIKKQQWATQNALKKKNYGINYRSNFLSTMQKIRITLWPLYALSFIVPFFRSVLGFIQEKETLWFFHPLMCWVSVVTSFLQIFHYNFSKTIVVLRD